MSYVDAHYDRKNNNIYIVERNKNRQKNIITARPDHVFYYEHPAGTHKTIFGNMCKKYITTDIKKFRGDLSKMKAEHRIFESDINPLFRYLNKRYSGIDSPELNIGFFDIEVDFDAEKGYAPVFDPFSKITAITLYNTYDEKLLSFVLAPDTLSYEEGIEIGNEFEDTSIFDNEAVLIDAFLTAIEDTDVITGWNCIEKNQSVWLKDKIIKLKDCSAENNTFNHGKIIEYHDSGLKKSNIIKLKNGIEIVASDEHMIPIFFKKINSYKYPSSLKDTKKTCSVAEIKELQKNNYDVFFEINLRDNKNYDLNYRTLVIDNIDYLFDRKDLYFYNSEKNIILGKNEIVNYCLLNNVVNIKFDKSKEFLLNLDEIIDSDILQLIGFQFTDGTYYKKGNMFTLYNKDACIYSYRDIILKHGNCKQNAKKTPLFAKGVYTIDYSRGNKFGLLNCFIYDNEYNKKLNIKAFSMLSKKQFLSFFSGLIDGDGCISNNMIQLCNFNMQLDSVQELLLWNGVYSSRTDNNLVIFPYSINRHFIEMMTLLQTDKKAKIKNLRYTFMKNCPNKKITKYLYDDHAIVRIDKIIETGNLVEMADIHTEKNHFVCNGINVHNSEGYDIPYLVNRTRIVLGEESLKRYCLFDEEPKLKEYFKFGKTFKTYELVGRVHLDYLLLYQKHTPQQRHSYRLDYIGEIEVGENKTPYDGTLDDLYKKDFKKFIAYNRQDVMILVKIDNELAYIDLANQIAHDNCVLLKTTMGTVSLVDQAIINEMHNIGLIVPDRNKTSDDEDDDEERTPVVGAYVADPKVGLHEHVGCIDLTSLYPSTLRAFNMSPETIVGQILPIETTKFIDNRIANGTKRAEAWEGLFTTIEVDHVIHETDDILTVEFYDKLHDLTTSKKITAKDFKAYLIDERNNICMSANGTLFRTDIDGAIPTLLETWFKQRKEMQKLSKDFGKLADGIEISQDLADLLR